MSTHFEVFQLSDVYSHVKAVIAGLQQPFKIREGQNGIPQCEVSDEGCGVAAEEEHSGQVRRHEHGSKRSRVGSVTVSCKETRFL